MCLLPVLLPLAKQTSHAVGEMRTITSQPVPPVCEIKGIPGYAFDGYTRLGKEALSILAKSNQGISRFVRHLQGQARSNALQYLLFEVEGGVCTTEISDLVRDELRRLAFGCWIGLPRDVLPEAVATMRDAIPQLNSIREFLSFRQGELFAP